jgi:hypothetical protein
VSSFYFPWSNVSLIQFCLAYFSAFFFAAVLISGLYAIIGALYNATSLEVKRCDSVTKSPILVGFGEVLQGQTSIRAYADTARFTRDLMTRLETNM